MEHILPPLVFALTAFAQGQPPATTAPNAPGQRGPGRGVGGPPDAISPEVSPDRSVIFRLRAAKATEVNLTGEFWEKTGVSEERAVGLY